MNTTDKIYEYVAEPHEVDEEHMHDFDTTLTILSGEIRIERDEDGVMADYALKSGDTIQIARNQKHSAVVGESGCTYIVAEKHPK